MEKYPAILADEPSLSMIRYVQLRFACNFINTVHTFIFEKGGEGGGCFTSVALGHLASMEESLLTNQDLKIEAFERKGLALNSSVDEI